MKRKHKRKIYALTDRLHASKAWSLMVSKWDAAISLAARPLFWLDERLDTCKINQENQRRCR